jgi:hypothetical protein
MKNNEFLGHKGHLKSSPKRLGLFTKKRGIYRLIFRVLALPSQLSAFERTGARISASDGHKCVRTQKRAFEHTTFRISPHM